MPHDKLTRRSTVAELYRSPMGRDLVDKLVFQLRLPRWLPRLIGWMRISALERLSARLAGAGVTSMILELANSEPDTPLTGPAPDPTPWWRDAVFYQIYPRSFADSNGDGIGDLRGVISRLDYLHELGVDCIWLSPIFASPNKDMGYDISDYRSIMAEMGTLDDVDDLVTGCHERGMRIILDLVVNHTSDQHEWFTKAIADPEGPYATYYFLEKGTAQNPPNNWKSYFSGPAWRWLPEAQRWALHLFTDAQMDLRWDTPAVREEVAAIVRWWMERGIDGFRLDVINYIAKRPGLPDGHRFVGKLLEYTGVENYFYGPQLHGFLRELRQKGFTRTTPPRSTPRRRSPNGVLGDPLPPETTGVMIGETPGIGMEMGRLLSGNGRGELDLNFNFDVLENPGYSRFDVYDYEPWHLKRFYRDYLSRLSAGDWIAVFLDNHDNPRMLSKFGRGRETDPGTRTAIGKMLATIQLTMRGTPFLYQGQEVGAVNQSFSSIHELRDIESINRHADLLASGMDPKEAWRQILSGARDHARAPMRWSPDGGFSTGRPWLDNTDQTPGFSAEEQTAEPDSIYAWHRDLIGLRRRHPALTSGTLTWVRERKKFYFAYLRELHGQCFLIECNTSAHPRRRPWLPRRLREARPVMGGPRGSVMRPWEATISLVC